MSLTSSRLTVSIVFFLTIVLNSHANAEDDSLVFENTSVSKAMWKDVAEQSQLNQQQAAKIITNPIEARFLELNELGFKTILNNSSLNSIAARTVTADNSSKTISLPLPDGSEVDFKITLNPIMTETLAAQFPVIKTWKVLGVSKEITGTIDFTYQGFHAMLRMPDGDTVFIEPNKLNSTSNQASRTLSENGQYLSFSKHANKENFKSEFSCGVHSDSPLNFSPAAKSTSGDTNLLEKLQAKPASDFITYRLAVATTGEYTQFHGGTVSEAVSAIATTINRVNEIYERDLSIKFMLVDEQSELIYLNPNTDPYSNNNVFKLIQENAQNLSSSGILSPDKYDVGHVFGAGNVGGLAQVGSVCNTSFKAQGATGIGNPIGEAFALDYVAHELGHQMGGSHTFNSACGDGSERTGLTAVEPGSGTTIMSYAGICQANNIQLSVDDYFHVVSIAQIREFTREDDGSGCGALTSTGNENPTLDVTSAYTVPARTPLVFVASGADTDGDALSYTWEQSDAGTVSNLDVDTGDNALFRSRPASASEVRFIPRLSDLFNNTTAKGELLPVTNRSIEMTGTVRDGKGGIQSELVDVSVFDTGGSFRVTSHNSSESIARGSQQTVRWDVAGTDTSPISCSTVDIGIATENGEVIVILTTANDGQQQITIPSNAPDMSNARFIVRCESGGFFNISSGRLIIGDVNNSGGGGGSIGIFMLSLFSMLVWRRKYYS